MKKIILIILFLFFSIKAHALMLSDVMIDNLMISDNSVPEGEDWFAYNFNLLNMDMNSPANVGNIVIGNDSPGDHGFIRVNGNHEVTSTLKSLSSSWYCEAQLGATCSLSNDGTIWTANLTNGSNTYWHANLRTSSPSSVNVTKDVVYRFNTEIKASRDMPIRLFTSAGGAFAPIKKDVTTSWQEYDFVFTASATLSNIKLAFGFGDGHTGDVIQFRRCNFGTGTSGDFPYNFEFEDNTLFKPWGTSTTFNNNFNNATISDAIAKDLRFFGFNTVRIHHLDFHDTPDGLWSDSNYMTFDSSQVDKLDRYMYALKNQGLYANMNTLVGRKWTAASGVTDYSSLGQGFNVEVLYDPILIQRQKEYMDMLYNHTNPYTGLRRPDDPMIGFVEQVNEVWFYRNWIYNYGIAETAYYDSQLDTYWTNYLKAKYDTLENLKTAWSLSSSDSSITNELNAIDSDWYCNNQSGAACSIAENAGIFTVTADTVTGTYWQAEFRTANPSGLTLTKDTTYRLHAEMKSSRTLSLRFFGDTDVFTNYSTLIEETVDENVETGWTEYDFVFTANVDKTDAKLAFGFGNLRAGDVVQFRNASFGTGGQLASEVEENSAASFSEFQRYDYKFLDYLQAAHKSDVIEFYTDEIGKKFFDTMRTYLKKDIGFKIPVTGVSGYHETMAITALRDMDYLDYHNYFDHPDSDGVISNISQLTATNFGSVNAIENHREDTQSKPITISEWNQPYPNQYAYEAPILMASKAVENGWNGLYYYAYLSSMDFEDNINYLEDNWSSYSDPQKMTLMSVGSIIFNKASNVTTDYTSGIYTVDSDEVICKVGTIGGQTLTIGNFTVEPQEDGAVCLYSPSLQAYTAGDVVMIVVGEEKNTGSSEDRTSDPYNWGTSPILLKNMRTKVTATSGYAAYKIDNKGTVAETMQLYSDGGGNDSFYTNTAYSPWFFIEQ